MTRLFPFLVFALLYATNSFGQYKHRIKNPNAIFEKAKSLENTSTTFPIAYDAWETEEPAFVFGSFTEANKKECIVVYPYEQGMRRRFIALVLLNKNEDGEWKDIKWSHVGGSEIEFLDINQDGIKEIKIYGSNYGQGSHEEDYTFLSLLANKTKILHERNVANNIDAYTYKEMQVGKIIQEFASYTYSTDEQGNSFIIEKIKTGTYTYPNKTKVEDRLKYTTKENRILVEIK